MTKLILLFVLGLILPSWGYSQCTTTNATACQCKTPGQTDCDLLPDIQIGHPPFFDYGNTYGIIEYSQTGNGVDNGRLKITVSSPNVGRGPLEVRTTNIFVCGTDTFVGTAPSICPDGITNPSILINQRIYHKNGNTMTYYDRPAGTMTYHPSHSHMHVDNWGNYSLRTRDTTKADPRDWPIIGAGTKLAFCLMDYGRCSGYPDHCLDSAGNSLNSNSDFPNYGLGGGNYNCSPSVQGISSGYVDVYWTSLDGMWIDVPPGTCNGEYWLVTEIDPNQNFLEEDETNNVFAVPYTLTKQEPNPNSQPAMVSISNSQLNLCQGESTVLSVDSTVAADSYLWSNGDTTRSTVISNSGIYSVQINNRCGTGLSYAVEVNVFNPPAAPVTVDDTIQTPGSAVLTASGADVTWYDAASGGNMVGSGNTFITPFINSTTTFWAEDAAVHSGNSFNVGPVDNTISGGGYYTGSQYMIFDAYNSFILHSVNVYAQSAGSRTIELSDNQGTLLQSVVVNVIPGLNTLILDFTILPGTGYRLTRSGGDLYRNNVASGITYPYTIDNVCSITGSSQGAAYYYFFYDWNVKLPDNTCLSPRSPAVARVEQPNSIADVNSIKSLQVFPNPASASVQLSFTLESGTKTTVELLDAVGKSVQLQELIANGNQYIANFHLQGLARGIYNIHILSDEKNYYHKLIVN